MEANTQNKNISICFLGSENTKNIIKKSAFKEEKERKSFDKYVIVRLNSDKILIYLTMKFFQSNVLYQDNDIVFVGDSYNEIKGYYDSCQNNFATNSKTIIVSNSKKKMKMKLKKRSKHLPIVLMLHYIL